MTPGERAAALAALALGLYLIAASLGAAPLSLNAAVGIPLAVFGAAYAALGGTREALLWGGVLTIAGVSTAAGGAAPPLLVAGVALVFVSLFALLAGRR
ncbi:hypothetical protein [Pyrobaculum neutrophilum]|uniref:Uncharacterized protein n=1 Tax=Pyrobaculum neutrophilum (strain DSM 2338 / JCM 9278 / NBRC 100436 / V24Sta) TaxID=444157 RepID=B1YDJ9_PYRNV|nr:hypothetical protein [Pyrobaculum neutrophilum]ACB39862.1 conserved hypothetical protein [Pyrobaculum neutrophilum V24Sta]